MANQRHADQETLDHLIRLQKRVAEAERITENALDGISVVHRQRMDLEDRVREAEDTESRLRFALNDITYLIRNEPDAPDLLARILGIAGRATGKKVTIKWQGPYNTVSPIGAAGSSNSSFRAIGANGGTGYGKDSG